MVPAGIIIALLSASEVSFAISPGARCVERGSLTSRLDAAGLRVSAVSSQLQVTIGSEGDSLLLRGVREGAAFERRVFAGAEECQAVERVIAALIVSWSSQLPTANVTPTKRPPPSASPVVTPVPETPEPGSEAALSKPPLPPVEPLVRKPLRWRVYR